LGIDSAAFKMESAEVGIKADSMKLAGISVNAKTASGWEGQIVTAQNSSTEAMLDQAIKYSTQLDVTLPQRLAKAIISGTEVLDFTLKDTKAKVAYAVKTVETGKTPNYPKDADFETTTLPIKGISINSSAEYDSYIFLRITAADGWTRSYYKIKVVVTDKPMITEILGLTEGSKSITFKLDNLDLEDEFCIGDPTSSSWQTIDNNGDATGEAYFNLDNESDVAKLQKLKDPRGSANLYAYAQSSEEKKPKQILEPIVGIAHSQSPQKTGWYFKVAGIASDESPLRLYDGDNDDWLKADSTYILFYTNTSGKKVAKVIKADSLAQTSLKLGEVSDKTEMSINKIVDNKQFEPNIYLGSACEQEESSITLDMTKLMINANLSSSEAANWNLFIGKYTSTDTAYTLPTTQKSKSTAVALTRENLTEMLDILRSLDTYNFYAKPAADKASLVTLFDKTLTIEKYPLKYNDSASENPLPRYIMADTIYAEVDTAVKTAVEIDNNYSVYLSDSGESDLLLCDRKSVYGTKLILGFTNASWQVAYNTSINRNLYLVKSNTIANIDVTNANETKSLKVNKWEYVNYPSWDSVEYKIGKSDYSTTNTIDPTTAPLSSPIPVGVPSELIKIDGFIYKADDAHGKTLLQLLTNNAVTTNDKVKLEKSKGTLVSLDTSVSTIDLTGVSIEKTTAFVLTTESAATVKNIGVSADKPENVRIDAKSNLTLDTVKVGTKLDIACYNDLTLTNVEAKEIATSDGAKSVTVVGGIGDKLTIGKADSIALSGNVSFKSIIINGASGTTPTVTVAGLDTAKLESITINSGNVKFTQLISGSSAAKVTIASGTVEFLPTDKVDITTTGNATVNGVTLPANVTASLKGDGKVTFATSDITKLLDKTISSTTSQDFVLPWNYAKVSIASGTNIVYNNNWNVVTVGPVAASGGTRYSAVYIATDGSATVGASTFYKLESTDADGIVFGTFTVGSAITFTAKSFTLTRKTREDVVTQ